MARLPRQPHSSEACQQDMLGPLPTADRLRVRHDMSNGPAEPAATHVDDAKVDVRQLARRVEEASLNAWPALQQLLIDGWLLRFAAGFTKRANSVVTLPGLHVTAPDVLLRRVVNCEQRYRYQGLKPVFRLTDIDAPEALDDLLARRGYQIVEPTDVLTLPLRAQAAQTAEAASLAPGAFKLLDRDAWVNLYATLADMPPASRPLHLALLKQILLPCDFYAWMDQDQPLACLLTVREQPLVGLFDLVTHPDWRRQGLARALLNRALRHAVTQGAELAWLQVVSDNQPAQALYQGLGFEPLYRYWYRVPA